MRTNTTLPLHSELFDAHPGQAPKWCMSAWLGSSAPECASSGNELSINAWPWLQDGSVVVEVEPAQPCDQAPNKPPKSFLACPSPHVLWCFRGLERALGIFMCKVGWIWYIMKC